MTRKKNPENYLPDGRPTKYKDTINKLAYQFCLLGATDAQLAKFFEVSEVTLNAWKHKHPKFLKSITRGKMVADAKVAEALFQRALGYEHTEEKIFNNQGEIIRVSTTKHYPPDTQAASLWLRNRQPRLWRDKTEQSVTVVTDLSKLDTDELLAMLKKTQEEREDAGKMLH